MTWQLTKLPFYNQIIVVYSWVFITLILTQLYSNDFYTHMLIPRKPKTIDSIIDLYQAQSNGEIMIKLANRGVKDWIKVNQFILVD